MKSAFAFLVVVALFAYVTAQPAIEPDQTPKASPPASDGIPKPAAPTDNQSPPADGVNALKPVFGGFVDTGKKVVTGATDLGFKFMEIFPAFGK